jgi:hypothetical protein
MASVSGLPVNRCLAWETIEFEKEHGDFDELMARAKRAEQLTASDALEARREGKLCTTQCQRCMLFA